MADLWTGFDLNEPGAEDDDDAAAFDLDEHEDGDGQAASVLWAVCVLMRSLQSRSPRLMTRRSCERAAMRTGGARA